MQGNKNVKVREIAVVLLRSRSALQS